MNLDKLLELAKNDPALKEELEHAKTEDFDTFCKRMANNEIKDYRPYLHNDFKLEHRIKMAEDQICIDELIKVDERELIPILIKNKKARLYYKNIALRGDTNEQYGLARLGLFPKILINSKDHPTIYETIKSNPTILPKALDLMNYRSDMSDTIEIYFEESTNPNIYYLEKFLKHPQNKNSCEHLHSKYQALTSTPSLIEKTMTPYQLYQSQNILWAQSLPAKTIEFMTTAEKEIGSISETDFDEIRRCKDNLAFHSFIKERTKPCH